MKNAGLAVAGVLAFVLVVVVVIVLAAGTSIFSAHVRAFVAKQTLNPGVTVQVFNPNNKIQSQGYFESLHADFQGDLAKIAIQKQTVAADPSSYNHANLDGLRLICVDAAQTYNAAARSISSQAFRSADLPPQLNPAPCAK